MDNNKTQGIAEADFYSIINNATLDNDLKHILVLRYIDKYDFVFISKCFGYPVSKVKRLYRKAIIKVAKTI